MRLFLWLALAAACIGLVCDAWPTNVFGVAGVFYLTLAVALVVVDMLTGFVLPITKAPS